MRNVLNISSKLKVQNVHLFHCMSERSVRINAIAHVFFLPFEIICLKRVNFLAIDKHTIVLLVVVISMIAFTGCQRVFRSSRGGH